MSDLGPIRANSTEGGDVYRPLQHRTKPCSKDSKLY